MEKSSLKPVWTEYLEKEDLDRILCGSKTVECRPQDAKYYSYKTPYVAAFTDGSRTVYIRVLKLNDHYSLKEFVEEWHHRAAPRVYNSETSEETMKYYLSMKNTEGKSMYSLDSHVTFIGFYLTSPELEQVHKLSDLVEKETDIIHRAKKRIKSLQQQIKKLEEQSSIGMCDCGSIYEKSKCSEVWGGRCSKCWRD